MIDIKVIGLKGYDDSERVQYMKERSALKEVNYGEKVPPVNYGAEIDTPVPFIAARETRFCDTDKIIEVEEK